MYRAIKLVARERVLDSMPPSAILAKWGLNEDLDARALAALTIFDQSDQLQTDEDPCGQYPGWVNIGGVCTNRGGRTLAWRTQMTPQDIEIWWSQLSPTERGIEMALAATAATTDRLGAAFNHIPEHTFDFTTGWIANNQQVIKDAGTRFDVSPALVAGILATEMLFDYDSTDAFADWHVIGDATGFASAHSATVKEAYDYLAAQLQPVEIHPLNIDPNAPNLEGGIPGSFLTVRSPLGTYTLSDEGTIAVAAMVARFYTDYYVGDPDIREHSPNLTAEDLENIQFNFHDPSNLSPEDMALIFGAYRAGVARVGHAGQGYSSVQEFQQRLDPRFMDELGMPQQFQLALPLMEFMAEQFDDEEP